MNKKIKIAAGILLALALIYIVYIVLKKRKERKAIEALNAATGTTGTGGSGGSSAPASNDNFPLQVGSTGARVKYLQQALNRIKKDNNLSVDGSFGDKTKNAIYLTMNTTFYPVTQEKYNEVLHKATSL